MNFQLAPWSGAVSKANTYDSSWRARRPRQTCAPLDPRRPLRRLGLKSHTANMLQNFADYLICCLMLPAHQHPVLLEYPVKNQ